MIIAQNLNKFVRIIKTLDSMACVFYNDNMSEPTSPDTNRPLAQEAPILDERQKLVQSLLTEFSDTLDVFPDELDDPVYRLSLIHI